MGRTLVHLTYRLEKGRGCNAPTFRTGTNIGRHIEATARTTNTITIDNRRRIRVAILIFTTMNSLIRLINSIIYDDKLFTAEELAAYKSRMSGATDDQLEAILKEAKQLERERWAEYERTRFKIQAA